MATSPDPSLPIEYVATAKIGEKGQLTVPKEYRDALALEAGAPITILRLGSSLMLIPEQSRFRQLCDRIVDSFARHEIPKEDILETLPAVRQRVFARHYPELSSKKSAQKTPGPAWRFAASGSSTSAAEPAAPPARSQRSTGHTSWGATSKSTCCDDHSAEHATAACNRASPSYRSNPALSRFATTRSASS